MLLFLHGAMVADGYDDCEGDLVEPHAQDRRAEDVGSASSSISMPTWTTRIVDAADLIVIYKAYPHNDYAERAGDLFDLMRRTLAGEIEPVMALFDCRVMGLFPTTREGPMVDFVARDVCAPRARTASSPFR